MNSDTKTLIKKMTGVAFLAALSYVFTAFLAIPYAGGAGYFNFGDVVDILAALLLGPIEGMCVGILGGTLADLSSGFAVFAPWTMLAKGSMSLVTGLLFHILRNKKYLKFIAPFIGAVFGVLAYVPAYIIIYDVSAIAASTPFDCIQCFGAAIVALAAYIPLNKIPLLKNN